jgi:hypothetical protein
MLVGLGSVFGHKNDVMSADQIDGAEVDAFLKGYKLEKYQSGFMEALHNGWMGDIADEIARKTGFRLVNLGTLPQGFSGFSMLRWNAGGTGQVSHLLFWKPVVWTNQYYSYYYKDFDIRALQGALQLLGYYEKGGVDGLAGSLTEKAVRKFQASQKLPQTGSPDVETMFLLEYLTLGAGNLGDAVPDPS